MDISDWMTQTFGWIQWSEAFLQGGIGGLILGLGRFIVSFAGMDHLDHETKYGRFFASHLVAALLFGVLGGAITWAFEGKAGNVSQGISAMLLLGLLAGKLLPEMSGQQNSSTPDSQSQQNTEGTQ